MSPRSGEAEALAESRASLLARQERFLHDVSHELRTPVTIARGHLELLRRRTEDSGELAVALDELGRIDRIIDRLLLLAKADRPDFLVTRELDVEAFLEDVFVRWSEVAPRGWRLGATAHGALWADEEALRVALDALLENAVKYTEPGEMIELRAKPRRELVVEVADDGCGIPPDALDRIFERFARVDDAALEGDRRCRPRPLDRRRDREGARRLLRRLLRAGRDGLLAPAAVVPRVAAARGGRSAACGGSDASAGDHLSLDVEVVPTQNGLEGSTAGRNVQVRFAANVARVTAGTVAA